VTAASPASPQPDVPAAYRALRDDAMQVLHRWRAPDAGQERLRRELFAHCDQHPAALWKQGPRAHLTASTLVLNVRLDEVLLTLHAKARMWLQFGGHFEPGDTTVLAAATREAREESGLNELVLHPELVQLDRHRLLASGFGRCSEHLDLRYAAVTDTPHDYAVSHESLDVAWWPVESLSPESQGEIRPLVDAARRLLG
jgi:8-oxo-dGTP pyrophosphatase MutT (NUDIX family)